MNDPTSRENFERLLDGLVDGLLTDAEHQQLAQRIRTDRNMRDAYASYMALHAVLKLEHVRPIVPLDGRDAATVGFEPNTSVNHRSRGTEPVVLTPIRPVLLQGFFGRVTRRVSHSPLITTALVATLCYGTFTLLAWNLRSGSTPDSISGRDNVAVAVIAGATDVRWSPETARKSNRATVHRGEPFKLDDGVVEIELKRGTKLVVQGPAEWTIDGENQATLQLGMLVATVPPSAVGFTLQTPTAKIVDLGTEFAAEVGPDRQTEVHVFKGTVVAQQARPSAISNDAVRLSAGEALKIGDRSAPFTSIPVRPERYLKGTKPQSKSTITAVQSSSGQEYRVVPGGLRDEALAYIDRAYEWNGLNKDGIPASLLGIDYVQTACSDKNDPRFEMCVTLSKPATLYVFFDKHAPQTPDWITKFFTDTGLEIGLDAIPAVGKGPGESIDRTFTVWKRHFKAGTAWLGPNAWNGGHYGIGVIADPVTESRTEAKHQ